MTNNIEPINSDIYIFQARLSNLVSMLFTKTYLQYNDDDSVLVGGNKTLIKSSKNGDRISDAGDNIGAFIVDDNIKTSQQINTSIVGQDDITEFGTLKTKRTKNKLDLSQLINNESATKIITRLFRLLRFNLLNLDVTENQDVVVSFSNQKIDTFNRKDGLDNKHLKVSYVGKPLFRPIEITHKTFLNAPKLLNKGFKNSLKIDDQNKAMPFVFSWQMSADDNDKIFWFGFGGIAKYFTKEEFKSALNMENTVIYSADEFLKLGKPNSDGWWGIDLVMNFLSYPVNDQNHAKFYLTNTIYIFKNRIQVGFYLVFNGKIIHDNNGTDVNIDVDFSKYKDVEINLSVFDVNIYGYKHNGEKKVLVNKNNIPYYSSIEPYFQKLIYAINSLDDTKHAKLLENWFKLQSNGTKIKKWILDVKNHLKSGPIYQTVVKQDKITTMPLIRCIDSKEQGDYNE